MKQRIGGIRRAGRAAPNVPAAEVSVEIGRPSVARVAIAIGHRRSSAPRSARHHPWAVSKTQIATMTHGSVLIN